VLFVFAQSSIGTSQINLKPLCSNNNGFRYTYPFNPNNPWLNNYRFRLIRVIRVIRVQKSFRFRYTYPFNPNNPWLKNLELEN